VEVGGKDRDKPDELIQYIIKNLWYICFANPSACQTDLDYNDAEKMDASPSVDARRWDPERVPYLEQAKGGTSMKNIAHMGQLMKYHRFARYNYGYAQGYPIPLDHTSIPTAIFVARHDQLADVKDNQRLCKEINNCIKFSILEDEDHQSVTFSKNMTYFEEVLDLMNKYN